MKSSISTTGASPSVAPPTRSFNVLLADGSRLRVTCRDLAAQLRQERSATLKRLRQARAEALADIADRVSEARIRREFEASERAMDAAIRRLSKQVRVRPEPRRPSMRAPSSRSRAVHTGHAGVVFTRRMTSALARRDKLGREGIMLRIRYVRAGGKHASPGCLRRHWRYIAREAAVTIDSDGRRIVLGNLGDTDEDVAAGLDLQEQVLRAMRKNAKLGFRMIGAFPYGLPVDARREVLQRLGEELFGARDLPWTAAAHDADPGAAVDNPHFHLDYGLLPMARQADGSFVVSNDLRTDLDGQEGLRFIRHTVARVMTEVAREHGLDRSFTALSYRERGMDREGGEHVGQEGTAAHRRGEHVASIARNEAKQRGAEAREKARRAHERLDALERLKRAIGGPAVPPHEASAPFGIDESTLVALADAPAIADIIPLIGTQAIDGAPPMSIVEPAMTPPIIFDAGDTGAMTPAMPHLFTVGGAAPVSVSIPAPAAIPPAGSSVKSPPEIVHIGDTALSSGAQQNDAELPMTVALSDPPHAIVSLPNQSVIGPAVPVVLAMPAIVALQNPAPRMTNAELPHLVSEPVPDIGDGPKIFAVRDRVPGTAIPPQISRVGADVQQPISAPTVVWNIRRAIKTDAIDRETERCFREMLEDDEVRNRYVADLAAFEALRRYDEWLGQDDEGRYTVSDAALRASGLTRADLDTPAAQAALEAIGFDQVDRLDPVLDNRSGLSVFHIDQGSLRLDDRFPARLRDDVARWRESPHFRSLVGHVWPELRDALALASSVPVTADEERQRPLTNLFVAEPPGAAWHRARAAREKAMRASDAFERRDGSDLTQPGRRIMRPGADGIADAVPVARRVPNMPGAGIGG